ncbi:MAG: acyltransferase family protein [Bacteroidota bacterium]
MAQYLSYIHNLRGLAILIIVSVHARGYEQDWHSNPATRHVLNTFFDASEGNGTVLFVFIAGFLFQHIYHHNFNFMEYLRKKFKVIIVPYIVISVPLILFRVYSGFESLSLPPGFHEYTPAYQFFYMLLTGTHLPPFWFILMVILIYLSTPLLYALDKSGFHHYVFPLIIVMGFFTFRPEHNANPILAYLHFIPIYVAGMLASYNKEWILSAGLKLLIPLVLIYVALVASDLTGWLRLNPGISFEKVIRDQQLTFNIYYFEAFVLCLILVIVFHRLKKLPMPFLEIIGHYSFGIYFLHFIFISISREMLNRLGYTLDFSLLSYLLYFLLILLLSVTAVYFLKKLTGHYSRYLIGS